MYPEIERAAADAYIAEAGALLEDDPSAAAEGLLRELQRVRAAYSPSYDWERIPRQFEWLQVRHLAWLVRASGHVQDVLVASPIRYGRGREHETMIYDRGSGLYTPRLDAFIAEGRRFAPWIGDRSQVRGYASRQAKEVREYAGTRYFHMLDGVYDRERDELLPHTPEIVFTAGQSTGRRYDPAAGVRNTGFSFGEEGRPVAWVIGVEAHDSGAWDGCRILVLCPLCDCVHRHGASNFEKQPGHRSRHCNGGEFRMSGTDYVIQWPDERTLSERIGHDEALRLSRTAAKGRRTKSRIDTSEFTTEGRMPESLRRQLGVPI